MRPADGSKKYAQVTLNNGHLYPASGFTPAIGETEGCYFRASCQTWKADQPHARTSTGNLEAEFMQEPRFKVGIYGKVEDEVESMSSNCFIHVTPWVQLASRRPKTRHLAKMIVHPTLRLALRNRIENILLFCSRARRNGW